MKLKWNRNSKKEPLKESRTLFANQIIPEELKDNEVAERFCDNTIKSSKYTLVNFLPKNLFEQFRRIANFYFLCLCIIHFSINSPVSPLTSLLPLLFVVIVTGVKQGFEDWKRHKEDKKENNIPALVIRENKHQSTEDDVFLDSLQKTTRSEINVGDIVKVCEDEEFPADLLFISGSNEEGKCDVTTANLDGETNLKIFLVPKDLKYLRSEDDLLNLVALVECQHPQTNLYDFKGRMKTFDSEPEKTISLSTENLLLRGARLKNSEYIFGLAIYTGIDTKMAMNSKMTTSKFSTAERTTNYYLLFYLGVLFVEVFLCMMLKYHIDWVNTGPMWYLGVANDADKRNIGQAFNDSFSFFILFSYIIPISLYVTLELQKFLGSFFFQWDENISFDGELPVCNTSDLNEELGQVQYLFTDKTGTLTENSMHFRQCSIAGVKFIDKKGELKSLDVESIVPIPENIVDLSESFLITLSLCHTVRLNKLFTAEDDPSFDGVLVTENSDDALEMVDCVKNFLASSPDEKALVEASAMFGVEFDGEVEGKIKLLIQGVEKYFQRLETLEFDADRKLMSVIVRDMKSNEILLLTKGAESSVFRRCVSKELRDQVLLEMTIKHIDDFAQLGLRTLAVAKKSLTEEEYKILSRRLSDAKEEINGREEAVRRVMDDIEKDLTLLGATGVEDLLQDGVQETLESLSVAGIKVWVLTGDKIETAVNIAYLCGLFKRFTTLIYLTHLDTTAGAEQKLQESDAELLETSDNHFGLVVDGTSLLLLLEEFRAPFYNVCSKCSAVICCRMSPKQKAEIVHLVKTSSPKRTICAAIGDGANDVSMIQEAHIGLGIMGKEGRQAVRCSDFAFAKFRFLQRALLVHGHWYYSRIATVIHYCFYKNVAFISAQVFYTFQSAYSTESIYEGAILTLFNTTFTALPIIVYGLLEQPHSDKELLSKPYLYKTIAGNKNMSWSEFSKWGALGLWHSIVMYYGLVLCTKDSTAGVPGGKTQDYFLFGMALSTFIVILCNLKLIIESKYQTALFLGSIGFTLFFFYLFYFIYCAVKPTLGIFWVFYIMHSVLDYYFAFFLLIVTAFLPDILIKVYNNSQNLQELLSKYSNEVFIVLKIRKKYM